MGGSFVSTSSAGGRIQPKIDAALLPESKNTRLVPKGTIM